MNFESIKSNYYSRCPVPEGRGRPQVYSDIVLHLPVLEYYASLCNHVTEFGVREAHSTIAFLSGAKSEVVSYDIQKTPMVEKLQMVDLPCKWTFHVADTGDDSFPQKIAQTDLLFFDTLHTYDHLMKELRCVGKVNKFLAFHDTETCGEFDKSGPNPKAKGILPAIKLFLSINEEYEIVYQTKANNGLMILGKKQ